MQSSREYLNGYCLRRDIWEELYLRGAPHKHHHNTASLPAAEEPMVADHQMFPQNFGSPGMH